MVVLSSAKFVSEVHVDGGVGQKPRQQAEGDSSLFVAGRRINIGNDLADLFLQIIDKLEESHSANVKVEISEELYSTERVAQILGVSRPTVVRMCNIGELDYEMHGTHRRIRRSTLDRYLASLRKQRFEALDAMMDLEIESGVEITSADIDAMEARKSKKAS